VHMRNVDVSYGHTRVLNEVNWTVREGERWALVGPNGSGKTTLLSLILGDNPQAYKNDISLFGRQRGSGESIWSVKQHIGWMSPELHMYYPKHFTCLQAVCSGFFDSVGLYAACSPEQQAAVQSWMKRLGISQYAHAALSDVSHGEQRVVFMARALVKHPQLLVLDEPCQGLDAENRDQILSTIDLLGRQTDMTMIYVTHDVDQMPDVITHVLALEHGRVTSNATLSNTPQVPHVGSASEPSYAKCKEPCP
jgi:molybdate transport system ATP-binding protein